MKPPPFTYIAPTSVEEALAVLAEHGDEAKVLAGGQSLVPLMALRMAHPSVLVDINGVDGLASVTTTNGQLTIGAGVRERAAERSEAVQSAATLLADALPLIGHEAIRTRGTVGGSLAHADPAAELPAVALALDAQLVATSKGRGERVVPAVDFFLGYFTTALEPDELLTEIRFPTAPPGTGVCFAEVARRHGDFAMVGAAASVTLSGGSISDVRLAMIGVAEVPVRASDAERTLVGSAPGDDAFRSAADAAVRDLAPSSDLHASAAYRRHVAAVLIRRALATASQRAQETA